MSGLSSNWSEFQFVDAAGAGGLNAAFGTVSGAIAGVGGSVWSQPGLIYPEAAQVTFSGMVATVGLFKPWTLVSSGGVAVQAHGTQSNADTQEYTVNFAPLVPGAGSVTAYLAATVVNIQQNPVPIPGPPPGHPSYNPNYVPGVGYAINVASVALSAVSGGIDNVNTFELFRTTLTAGQVAVSTWSNQYRQRNGIQRGYPNTNSKFTTGGVIAIGQAQGMLTTDIPGLTQTLPVNADAGFLLFRFINASTGSWTIVTQGSDTILGLASGPTNSIGIPQDGSVTLWADGAGFFFIVAFSPNVL
jgi:hypothetical protein